MNTDGRIVVLYVNHLFSLMKMFKAHNFLFSNPDLFDVYVNMYVRHYNLSSMVVIVTTSLLIGSLSSSDTFGGGSWGHTRLLDWPRRD